MQLISYATALYNAGFNLATATLVLFSSETLELDSTGYGMLVAAMAVGTIIGGWKISGAINRFPDNGVVAGALALQGAWWAVIAVFPVLPVVLAALVCIGVATVLITVACTGQLQRVVPDAMMGRATAIYWVFAIGAGGLGAVAGGVVTNAGGLTAGLITAAVILVAAGVVLAIRARRR